MQCSDDNDVETAGGGTVKRGCQRVCACVSWWLSVNRRVTCLMRSAPGGRGGVHPLQGFVATCINLRVNKVVQNADCVCVYVCE